MLNRVILHGRIGKRPEQKQTGNGVACTQFSLAVARDYRDATGNRDCDWFSVTAWRHTAEIVAKHFDKGSQIIVEGRLRSRTCAAQDGARRTAVDVVADRVYFCGGKGDAPETAEADLAAQGFVPGFAGTDTAVQGFAPGFAGEDLAVQGFAPGFAGADTSVQGFVPGFAGTDTAVQGFAPGFAGTDMTVQGFAPGAAGPNVAAQGFEPVDDEELPF